MWRDAPWRTSVVAAAALIAAAMPGSLESLRLDRTALFGGEIWRLLGCHLVHGSSAHLLWDVLPLILLGLLFEGALRGRTWVVLGVSAMLVSAGVLLWQPQFESYAGLSGALNGLWVGGALAAARLEAAAGRTGMARLFHLCVVADLVKIALEIGTGVGLFTDAASLGGIPVPAAHAFGALGGLVALAPASRSRRRPLRADLSMGRRRTPEATPCRSGGAWSWAPRPVEVSSGPRRSLR